MKYYKVIKENFLWEVDAIISKNTDDNGYDPIDDIYLKHEESDEYISTDIVENSPEYFKRVYKVSLATRTLYETKDRAKELIGKQFNT